MTLFLQDRFDNSVHSYQVATLVKAQGLEGDDGIGSGSQRRLFLSLALIVSWLLAMAHYKKVNNVVRHVQVC